MVTVSCGDVGASDDVGGVDDASGCDGDGGCYTGRDSGGGGSRNGANPVYSTNFESIVVVYPLTHKRQLCVWCLYD